MNARRLYARITRQLGVGHAGSLEIQDVEEVIPVHALHGLSRPVFAASGVWHAQSDNGADAFGHALCHVPRHRRAPVVADDDRLFFSVVIYQPDNVVGEADHVIGVDRVRARRPPVAALVWSDDAVARFYQRGYLVAPGIVELGKAVAQDHQPTVAHVREARLDHFELDVVERHKRHRYSCEITSPWKRSSAVRKPAGSNASGGITSRVTPRSS